MYTHLILSLAPVTQTTLANPGVRPIDFAAFGVMALVWVFVALLLLFVRSVVRERKAGGGEWGNSPGL